MYQKDEIKKASQIDIVKLAIHEGYNPKSR